jgi:hypothetical protein
MVTFAASVLVTTPSITSFGSALLRFTSIIFVQLVKNMATAMRDANFFIG